jgi:hypothetical protein
MEGVRMHDPGPDPNLPPITSLSKKQRRVLGTLIEKALTVPDSYPLTINSLISGCNQKSNRSPLTNYDETDIEDTLNELRDLGLVAELLLRGRQAAGELRTRAGRMAPKGSLETQEQLRTELQGLLTQKLIQADGPLERRGVEVDHNLYQPQEGQTLAYREGEPEELPPATPSRPASVMTTVATATPDAGRSAVPPVGPDPGLQELRRRQAELADQFEELRRQLADVVEAVDRLKRDLGV